MSTFQAIVYGIVQGFSEFLPLSGNAHRILAPYLLNWPAPTGALLGALSLGSLIALMLYFFHDWASIISSFLQVVIYRKKPMTLDERMPFFIAISAAPMVLTGFYLIPRVQEFVSANPGRVPMWLAGSLALFVLPLWVGDYWSRKNKEIFAWNWLDALWVGIFQAFSWIPGLDRSTAGLAGAMFRNYSRDAGAKFVFFAAAPFLVWSSISGLRGLSFSAPSAMEGVSWFTWVVALIVSVLASLLAIGGLRRYLQINGFRQYLLYRLILAVAVASVFFIRSRS